MPKEQQEKVLEVIKEKGNITAKDISEIKSTEQVDPEEWLKEDEAEEEAATPDSMVNEYGIYKSQFIETIVIEIPKKIGNITLEMVYDPADGLYHPGIDYWINKHKGGGSRAPSKKCGFSSEEEAVREAFSGLIKDDEIRKALIRAGYATEVDYTEPETEEPLLLRIEAAKYAMKLLEKETNRCISLQNIEEEENNTDKANQQIFNIKYLGELMQKVHADLFEMTGSDMFKD